MVEIEKKMRLMFPLHVSCSSFSCSMLSDLPDPTTLKKNLPGSFFSSLSLSLFVHSTLAMFHLRTRYSRTRVRERRRAFCHARSLCASRVVVCVHKLQGWVEMALQRIRLVCFPLRVAS